MRDLDKRTTVKRIFDDYHMCRRGLHSSESEQDAVGGVKTT